MSFLHSCAMQSRGFQGHVLMFGGVGCHCASRVCCLQVCFNWVHNVSSTAALISLHTALTVEPLMVLGIPIKELYTKSNHLKRNELVH